MVHFHGEGANDEAKAYIEQLHVGGFIYYNWSNGLTSPEQVRNLSATLQKMAKIPLLLAVDQEGGRVARLKEGFTQFPGNGAISSAEEARQTGVTLGKELKGVGINLNFAPVVDVLIDPKSPIGNRSFGADPERVTTYARAMLEGFHSQGVMGTLKHYPGLGVAVDSHEDLPVIKEGLETGLMPFLALKEECDAIMTAHVLVPSIDPDHCATLSAKVLGKIQPFKGLIVTDSLIMEGVLKEAGSVESAAIKAFQAGCDILLLGGKLIDKEGTKELKFGDVQRIHQTLVENFRNGTLSIEQLDRTLKKIGTIKSRSGIAS